MSLYYFLSQIIPVQSSMSSVVRGVAACNELKCWIIPAALHLDFWIFPQFLEMEAGVLSLEMEMAIRWNEFSTAFDFRLGWLMLGRLKIPEFMMYFTKNGDPC